MSKSTNIIIEQKLVQKFSRYDPEVIRYILDEFAAGDEFAAEDILKDLNPQMISDIKESLKASSQQQQASSSSSLSTLQQKKKVTPKQMKLIKEFQSISAVQSMLKSIEFLERGDWKVEPSLNFYFGNVDMSNEEFFVDDSHLVEVLEETEEDVLEYFLETNTFDWNRFEKLLQNNPTDMKNWQNLLQKVSKHPNMASLVQQKQHFFFQILSTSYQDLQKDMLSLFYSCNRHLVIPMYLSQELFVMDTPLLSDVELQLSEQISDSQTMTCCIHAHKQLLCQRSTFFQNFFVQPHASTVSLNQLLCIKSIPISVFQVVMEYLYSGLLQITNENVIELYTICEALQLFLGCTMCSQFVEYCTDISHLVTLYLQSKTKQQFSFVTLSQQGLLRNITLLLKYHLKEFCKLPEEFVWQMIQSEQIKFGKNWSEADLFHAVHQWFIVHYNSPTHEKEKWNSMMKWIKFGTMKAEELYRIEKLQIVEEELLVEGYRTILAGGFTEKDSKIEEYFSSFRTRPRVLTLESNVIPTQVQSEPTIPVATSSETGDYYESYDEYANLFE